MELLAIAIGSLIVLAVASFRFGVDSRSGFRTPERPLGDMRKRRPDTHIRIITLPATFPTLEAIDKARPADAAPLATDADASYLERRARALTQEHWSENAWLTGRVPAAQFDAVVEEIELERQEESGPVRIYTTDDIDIPEAVIG